MHRPVLPCSTGTNCCVVQVFKGVLDGVQTVAVKQLLEQNAYQQQKFANEIAILRSCRNENIVCFLGKPASMF